FGQVRLWIAVDVENRQISIEYALGQDQRHPSVLAKRPGGHSLGLGLDGGHQDSSRLGRPAGGQRLRSARASGRRTGGHERYQDQWGEEEWSHHPAPHANRRVSTGMLPMTSGSPSRTRIISSSLTAYGFPSSAHTHSTDSTWSCFRTSSIGS